MELDVGEFTDGHLRPGFANLVGGAEESGIGGRQHDGAAARNGDPVHGAKVVVRRPCELLPRRTAVDRTEDASPADCIEVVEALTRSRVQNQRRFRIHCETRDGKVCHEVVDRCPLQAAILRVPDAAAGAADPDALRVGRMHDDRPCTAADVARPEPLPRARSKPCDCGQRNQRRWRDGSRHGKSGLHHAPLRHLGAQRAQVAERFAQRVGWNRAVVVARLTNSKRCASTRQIRIIQAPDGS